MASLNTYRTDWIGQDLNPHGNRVDFSLHGTDLKAARAMARKMSRATGAAYVIRTTDGQDDGHIPYTDGTADARQFESA